MYFLPISLALFVLFLALIPVLIFLLPGVAFAKMGLDPAVGYAFFLLCLLGGSVNYPVYREKMPVKIDRDDFSLMIHRFMGVRIPVYSEQVIAVNLGGAILPTLLSLYLLSRVPLMTALVATAVMSVVAYLLSKPVRGVGIIMPPFVPPFIAAIIGIVFSREHAPQIAYISGVMGTLIGADLVRLPQLRKLDAPFLSIGGAGIFDGIFLVGLVSVLLA
jgi:uncharacterized membrane protein